MNRPTYYPMLAVVLGGLLAVSCARSAVTSNPPATPATATIAVPATSVPPSATLAPSVAPQPTRPPPTETPPLPTATAALSPTSVLPTPAPTDLPPASAIIAKEPGGELDWEETAVPATFAAVASPTQSSSSGGGLDAIIPPGKGRELLFSNCTSCHSFVCSVIGQRTEGNWLTIRKGHSDRVSALGEKDQDVLYSYLLENFGDQKSEPELPPELREQGCSAQ